MQSMTPSESSSPAMEFLVNSLKKDKSATYGDLKAKADEKKLKVFPIMFGRAKALLGLVKVAKRGTGKHARASAAMAAKGTGKRGRPADASSKSGKIRALLDSGMSVGDIAKKVGATPALVYNVRARASGGGAKRGPGRPRKSSGSSGLDGITGILEAVKNSQRERERMQVALEKIQTVIADALG